MEKGLLFSRYVVSHSFVTPETIACQAPLSSTISQSLLKLISTESVTLSNHLTLCHPLLLLPSIFSSIRVFSDESALRIRWPKYWSCSFNISPSKEYSGLSSFTIDWFDVLAVQGTLKSLLQHHSSKYPFYSIFLFNFFIPQRRLFPIPSTKWFKFSSLVYDATNITSQFYIYMVLVQNSSVCSIGLFTHSYANSLDCKDIKPVNPKRNQS